MPRRCLPNSRRPPRSLNRECASRLAAAVKGEGRRDENTVSKTRRRFDWCLSARLCWLGRDVKAALLGLTHPHAASLLTTLDNLPEVLALRVIAAGKPLIVEKPAGLTLGEVLRLEEAATQHGVLASVLYPRRFHPCMMAARQRILAGEIGPLFTMESRFLTTQVRFRQPESWLLRRAQAGGGILLWLGCHCLDLMHYVTGDEITEVGANSRPGSARPSMSRTRWCWPCSFAPVRSAPFTPATPSRSVGRLREPRELQFLPGLQRPRGTYRLAGSYTPALDRKLADAVRTARLVEAAEQSAREGRFIRIETAAGLGRGAAPSVPAVAGATLVAGGGSAPNEPAPRWPEAPAPIPSAWSRRFST